ncbi:MAG: HAD family hydrolase [Campylobacterales bacterium]|nr:HAD family hydrolase [Campylobacterales bacterium]
MLKKAIIFDMDGTLVDSSRALSNAINYVREQLHLPPLEHTDIISKINDHSINAAQYFYKSKHFIPDHQKWFSSYYSANHHKELVLYDGIKELLESLKGNDLKLAVATNAYRNSAIESLVHLDINDYFDAVVCFDDVKEGKPSPQMLEKITELFSLETEHALFIGDGERDQMAASRAGMDYIMVSWGFSKHDSAVNSVEKLKEILLEINF